MSLRGRIGGLERRIGPGDREPGCNTCGWPGDKLWGVVVSFDGNKPPRCPACGNLVEEDGRTAGRKCVVIWGAPDTEGGDAMAGHG